MTVTPSIVALIPARAGSKRVPGKNIRRLGAHPVLAYTIAAAVDSGIFADVIVSTDDEQYAAIARHYGANAPFMRPVELAATDRPTSNGSSMRSHGSAMAAAPSIASACCVRRVRSAWRQRFGVRGASFWVGPASTRFGPSSAAASIRARCGWCEGSA